MRESIRTPAEDVKPPSIAPPSGASFGPDLRIARPAGGPTRGIGAVWGGAFGHAGAVRKIDTISLTGMTDTSMWSRRRIAGCDPLRPGATRGRLLPSTRWTEGSEGPVHGMCETTIGTDLRSVPLRPEAASYGIPHRPRVSRAVPRRRPGLRRDGDGGPASGRLRRGPLARRSHAGQDRLADQPPSGVCPVRRQLVRTEHQSRQDVSRFRRGCRPLDGLL